MGTEVKNSNFRRKSNSALDCQRTPTTYTEQMNKGSRTKYRKTAAENSKSHKCLPTFLTIYKQKMGKPKLMNKTKSFANLGDFSRIATTRFFSLDSWASEVQERKSEKFPEVSEALGQGATRNVWNRWLF